MSAELQPQLTREREVDPTYTQYFFDFKGGDLVASYEERSRWYTIMSVDVPLKVRKQGIGKALLTRSLEHARELGAGLIIAGIASRECVDAMRSVFGEESLVIASLGEYADEKGNTPEGSEAIAGLRHVLD